MKKQTYDIFSKYRSIILGISILSIVFFHYTQSCLNHSYNFIGFNKLFHDYISSAGVDICFFISGLGLYFSWKKDSNYKNFLIKRIKRIITPYLLIAIPFFTIKGYLLNHLSLEYIVKGVTFYSYLHNGERLYWFIFAILIFYLIFPWIYEIVEDNKTKASSHISMITMFTFSTVISLLLQLYANDTFNVLNIILLRFPIFVLGAFIGRAAYEKREITNDWIAFIILVIVSIPLRSAKNVIIIRYLLGAISLAVIFIIVQIFEWLKKHKISLIWLRKCLEWFGNHSLELYLSHVTVLTIMEKLGYRVCITKFFLVMFIISIVISIVIKFLTNKINSIKFKRKTC